MVDHYRNLLSIETKYLTERIEQYDKILNDQLDNIPETVIDEIRLVVGQSNLFINERFKQFSGLIDDCALKRGEKETKVEDLAGFWDMIYYQVEDLKTKYTKLDRLSENNWVPIDVDPAPTVTDGQATRKPVVKRMDKKSEVSSMKPSIGSINSENNSKNSDKSHPERTTRTTTVASKKPVKSNFREFLMSKRKEMPKSNSTVTTLPVVVVSNNRPTVRCDVQSKQNGSAVSVKQNGTSNHSKIITISNGVTTVSNGHHRTSHNGNNCLQQVNGAGVGQNHQNGITAVNGVGGHPHHLNLNNGNGAVCNGLKSPLHQHNLHTSIITVNHHGDVNDNKDNSNSNPIRVDHNNKLANLHNNHQQPKQLHVDINTAASIENLKLKNLSDLMTRSLTVIDDTNKEN